MIGIHRGGPMTTVIARKVKPGWLTCYNRGYAFTDKRGPDRSIEHNLNAQFSVVIFPRALLTCVPTYIRSVVFRANIYTFDLRGP